VVTTNPKSEIQPILQTSYNLRGILIALGALIAEMVFPGQAGMGIS
jgi:hypothetical protein